MISDPKASQIIPFGKYWPLGVRLPIHIPERESSAAAGFDLPCEKGRHKRLLARGHAKPEPGLVEMAPDGRHADIQPRGDLGVGQTLRIKSQAIAFPGRQTRRGLMQRRSTRQSADMFVRDDGGGAHGAL